MQSRENYRGARHRTLILIYSVWLTLSLAPAMVAPPERAFQQGQPEMQQAMDNMVTRPTFIQKRVIRSPPKEGNIEDLNTKTSILLADAEKILKTLPDSKERHWIEAFVEKMQEIAKLLEETAQHKKQAEDSDSVKRAPVQDGLPKQSQRPAPSAVPETFPSQKPIDMMSKTEMTSSEILENDSRSEHQTVSRPVQMQPVLSSKIEEAESDELVRELESLHEEKTHQVSSESPKMVNDEAQITTTPSSSSKRNYIPSLKEEAEKAKLRAKLIEEIDEFHRLGGVMPKEVIDVLYADNHKIPDSVLSRKLNIDEEMKSGMQGMIRLDDVNTEDKEISMANMKNLLPYPAQQYQYMKFNHTFPYRHPNFVQAFTRQNGYYFQNTPPKAQFYQGNPQNLERMNPYNQGKYNLAMFQQPGPVPDAFKQRLPKPYNFYNGRLPPSNYHNYFMKHNYNPYPYTHNWNSQNSTTYLPQMMQPYVANRAKIDTQLSDEMKRELRDGKIIVLSDSVVRSNFDADKNEKITQSATGKPDSEKMDKKNETIAEN